MPHEQTYHISTWFGDFESTTVIFSAWANSVTIAGERSAKRVCTRIMLPNAWKNKMRRHLCLPEIDNDEMELSTTDSRSHFHSKEQKGAPQALQNYEKSQL